ncbi:MAG: hypothetical protein GTN49_05865 [candidate division Zixibacteria bacterium]|nr:hypothetical protein [candidate division Zixibacteria bacterium]
MSRKIRFAPGVALAVAGGAVVLVAFISLMPAKNAAAARRAKPATHDAAWAAEHATFAKSDVRSCYVCHEQSYCDACHASDDPKEAYHKTNYVYTHYLDKFIDDRECASCHDNQDFCVACHEASRAAAGGRPASHGQPGWTTVGHADVVAYELDACAACHDPVGAEPVCMRCHRSGISPHGEDTVTRMGKGPWHEDRGYVCFRCHNRTDFCTKCHPEL